MAPGVPLTDADRAWLSRWTVGGQPGTEWLAAGPPADRVHASLVKMLDRFGLDSVFARVLSAHLSVDPAEVFAENWPRKAARVAREARERGDRPHADRLHRALTALMYCGNCGRPLEDPVSIERGIGPDCWERIDLEWRQAIGGRMPHRVPAAGRRLRVRSALAALGRGVTSGEPPEQPSLFDLEAS